MEYAANDKIDQLLVKFLAGEASPAEEKEMLSWVESSEQNLHYFHQLSLLWNESNPAGINTPDENAAWAKFQAAISENPPGTRIIKFSWFRMVAAILIIAAGVLLTYSIYQPGEITPEQIVSRSGNEVKTDTLPDHSVVTLNKKAVLSYPSSFQKQRHVKLSGEAFFNIMPDKTKPFTIDVDNIRVKVIGTSFNIKNNNSATEIVVSTGIVRVTRENETIELRAGEQTTITALTNKLEKGSNTDKLFNYYVSRTFVCDNTPLWKLVDKLNEAYDVHITIAKKELRALPLTVTFNEESLDTIFEILSQTLMIKVTRNGDDIVLQ
ncbi:MAG: FecR domain-containing protein [Chitinophagaceae bacterium]|nr:FecR domain-containing protein [Chitinophagaceae bacterium]